jgi:ABC-type phosphate/phosphonate transport system substrate-binding protein
MNQRMIGFMVLLGVLAVFCRPGTSHAERLTFAVMQDQAGSAEKYEPMVQYFAKKGINVTLVPAQDYPSAAGMFAVGSVDAMFSGSGVAGFMMMKCHSVPVVRPVDENGHSTYWAVVIAKKGAPKYTGSAAYFSGKRVMFASLASSGDFYFHSMPGVKDAGATELNVGSHGAAIVGLDRGIADVAIVKNRVWDALKKNYPELTKVGEEKGENPDSTLIVSKNVPPALVAKIADILLGLQGDSSKEAAAVRNSLAIRGYIRTTEKDFEHTISLLKKANVTDQFNCQLQ